MSAFTIAGGDGASYGPRFGPLEVELVGQVPSAAGGHILFALSKPEWVEDTVIEFLAVRPRYVGTTLKDILSEGGTVGVWRVLPGHTGISEINERNSEYWAIGTCTAIGAQQGVPADAPALRAGVPSAASRPRRR